MNPIARIFYRLHMFYLFPDFWKEVKQTKRLISTFHFWQIEEETTRNK